MRPYGIGIHRHNTFVTPYGTACGSADTSKRPLLPAHLVLLDREQLQLDIDTLAVSAGAIRCHNPVAGYHDRKWVHAQGSTHSSRGPGPSCDLRDITVGRGGSAGDVEDCTVNGHLKIRTPAQIKIEIRARTSPYVLCNPRRHLRKLQVRGGPGETYAFYGSF